MILDSLANRELYRVLGERVAAGLDWLAAYRPGTEKGRYPILGDEVYASVQGYETAPATEKKWETHRLHLDIQLVVSGRERILWAPAAALEEKTAYDPAKDVTFYHDPPASSSLLLGPGDFAIFYPADGHKPGCMAGGRDAVEKVVVKVRL